MGTFLRLFRLLSCICLISCSPQLTSSEMKTDKNPLLCDINTGMCKTTAPNSSDSTLSINSNTKPIKIIYFTDPICSSCWGIEPQLRKLKLEYGDYIDIEYCMGGLLPDWSYNSGGISKPSDVAHHWDEVSAYYNMPIDGDIWLEDPLDSSYPPSIAFKAAQMQDTDKALRFLRKIREMVFLYKKNITKWEYLKEAAVFAGLDIEQFKADYEGDAKRAFEEDLSIGRKLGVRGFPTLFFSNTDHTQITLYGYRPYHAFTHAVTQLAPASTKNAYKNSWEDLFLKYNTLTTKEFSELTNTSIDQSINTLQKLADTDKLEKLSTKNGALWIYLKQNNNIGGE